MNQFVQVRHHYLAEGRVTVNPGSVVSMEEGLAEEFIKRGLGESHPGPVFFAPAPPEQTTPADPSEAVQVLAKPAAVKHDLGNKLARAERATVNP